MDVRRFNDASAATDAACDWLVEMLLKPTTRNVMVAGGNTPLALYGQVARRNLPLDHLHIFALDDYVGVPQDDPRNCANLLLRTVVRAWGIPAAQYHFLSTVEDEAARTIARHEERIRAAGGLDLIVLGLGRNGHIGFNEPGSEADSTGRVLSLSPVSVEANRDWFQGQYAPCRGVTTGMATILSARSVLLLAFGSAKASAVAAMIEGPQTPTCPASYLQGHASTFVFLNDEAAALLTTAATHQSDRR
jgi:glucosamine-6-phosphate deaminase